MIKNHKSVLDKITMYGFNLPIIKSPKPAPMQGHTSRGHTGVCVLLSSNVQRFNTAGNLVIGGSATKMVTLPL